MFGPSIGKLEKRGDVDALIGALTDKRRSVRDDAAGALARLGDARAVEPLTKMFEEARSERWRREGEWSRFSEEHRNAPGRFGLEAMLNDSAYDPVQEPGGKEVKKAVDDARQEMEVASGALGQFAQREDLRAIEFLLDAWGDMAASQPELAGCLTPDVLTRLLDAGSPTTRATAVRLLASLGDARSVEPLAAALEDEDPHVRSALTAALHRRGELTVESLGPYLESRYPDVRSWAAGELGELGGGNAAELLTGALDDEEAEVRAGAAVALGKLGHPGVVKPLIATLKDRGPKAREAFLVLQEIGGSEVEEAFAEGAPSVGDRVCVSESGERFAGMPGDRVEMGWGKVGEWRGTVVAKSRHGARVLCDEVEGEVEEVSPGSTRVMRLDPRNASELPGDPDHWRFEIG